MYSQLCDTITNSGIVVRFYCLLFWHRAISKVALKWNEATTLALARVFNVLNIRNTYTQQQLSLFVRKPNCKLHIFSFEFPARVYFYLSLLLIKLKTSLKRMRNCVELLNYKT